MASAEDIAALKADGKAYLPEQWPHLVGSILYLQSFVGQGVSGAPQVITLDVNGDAIGGTSPILFIDNFNSGLAGFLKHIDPTNYPEGQVIFVRISDVGTAGSLRSLKILYAVGGNGQLGLADPTSFYLNRYRQSLVLQLRSGTWFEIFRSGLEFVRKIQGATASDLPPLIGETDLAFVSVGVTTFNNVGSTVFYRRYNNEVLVHGVISSGATNLITPPPFAYGVTVTPLPVSYRPITDQVVPCQLYIPSTLASAAAFVQVGTDGHIAVFYPGAAPGVPGDFSFSILYETSTP